MIFLFWWFIGIVTSALITYKDWSEGRNITLHDLVIAALMSIAGPLLIIIVFMTAGSGIVVFKGKGR